MEKYAVLFDSDLKQPNWKLFQIFGQRISLLFSSPLYTQMKDWDVYTSGLYKLNSKLDPNPIPFTLRRVVMENASIMGVNTFIADLKESRRNDSYTKTALRYLWFNVWITHYVLMRKMQCRI
jgi:hypothetical protein